uniref:Uncharacterized protein n=1 Tax=Anguilla anguilla TaxID=7936 RepID=A0A0E9R2X6_ANGAN
MYKNAKLLTHTKHYKSRLAKFWPAIKSRLLTSELGQVTRNLF